MDELVAMESTNSVCITTLGCLKNCSINQLKALFSQVLGYPPPKRAREDFLRSNLAWAIQVLRLNKDPSDLRKDLMIKICNSTGTRRLNRYKPGTHLVREWQGKTYSVTVLDRGYLWQDEHYNSLSRIAEEITGTRWSGPRFFGLKDKSNG